MKKIFALLYTMIYSCIALAQTNPIPYNIKGNPFVFAGFANKTITDYPAGMLGWGGDRTIADSTQPAPTDVQAKSDLLLYNGSTATATSTIRNDSTGISLRAIKNDTSNNKYPMAIVVSISTIDVYSAFIKWSAISTSNDNVAVNALQLQYRIGHEGNWTNFTGQKARTDRDNATLFRFNGPVTPLPKELYNQSEVQFRWFYYKENADLGVTTDGGDRINLERITISAPTAPLPFTLANDDLFFHGFEDSSIEEYPSYLQGWKNTHFFAQQDAAAQTYYEIGDLGLSGQGAKPLEQISNEGIAGIGMKPGCSPESPAGLGLGLNTKGCDSVNIRWVANLLSDAPNVDTRVQLQFRKGVSGKWNNAPNNNYVATTGAALTNQAFNYTLPDSLENLANVQVRFAIYSISNGQLNFCNGDFVRLDTIFITKKKDNVVVQAPVADYTVDKQIPNVNEPIQFTDKSSGQPNTWSWDFGDGTNSTDQNPIKAYTTKGKYTVKLVVKNIGGMDSLTKTDYVDVQDPNSIFSKNALNISIYPNPANQQINFTKNINGALYRLYTVSGKLITMGKVENNTISTDELINGSYIVYVINNGEIQSANFLVRK